MKAINGCLVLEGEEIKFVIEYIDRLVHIQSRFLSDPDVVRVAPNNADRMSDWCDTANKMIRAVNMIIEIAKTDVWPKDLPKSKLAWNPDEFGADFKHINAETYWKLVKSALERKHKLEKEKGNASSDNK